MCYTLLLLETISDYVTQVSPTWQLCTEVLAEWQGGCYLIFYNFLVACKVFDTCSLATASRGRDVYRVSSLVGVKSFSSAISGYYQVWLVLFINFTLTFAHCDAHCDPGSVVCVHVA